MQKGISIILFCLIHIVSIAQNSVSSAYNVSPTGGNKTLLWRISGKGLPKSSYLFGTMHLKDKRLFNFDDSVYLSIEKCEGMAMEVNPDEMVAYFLNQALEEKANKTKVKDVMSEQDFKKYSRRLSAKFKKPAEDISTSDIVAEKNRWTNDIFEKGDMQTFVDAYLYGLARKQGKWVGGIEDIEDQSGLLENFDNSDIEYLVAPDAKSTTDKTIEQMITLYVNQDIDGIDQFMNNRYTRETNDKLLIRRNIKMARRMDSLSYIRSTFFAVGAAHLCGDSGVISLLKKNGFKVEPVFSAKKIPAGQYKVKSIDIPWIEVPGDKGLYSVSMPGNPATVKVSGLVNMKFLMDITNFTGQMTAAFPVPGNISNKDSLMNHLAKMMYQSKQKTHPKKINVNGSEGLEYLKSNDNLQIRMQLFFEQNVMYLVAMFAAKKDMLATSSANRFFNSFKLNKDAAKASEGMQYHIDSVMGIRLATPAPLTYAKQMSDTENEIWKISAFTATDFTSGIYIMLFSKEVKPRYHITTDTALYHEQYNRMQTVHSYFNQEVKITPQGKMVEYWGRNKENPQLYTRGVSTTRNNRNITLLILGDSVTLTNKNTNHIFSSLEFIPQRVQWKYYTEPESDIRVWLPGKLRSDEPEERASVRYAYDTTTATSYIVRIDTLGKYIQYAADSTFWNSTIKEIVDDHELVSQSDIKAGNVSGKELLVKHSGAYDNYTRMHIYVSGNRMYRLIAASGKNLLYSNDVNKMFSTFRIKAESGTQYLTSSKTKVILKDLLDTAQDTRYAAYHALETALVTKDDIALLQDCLFRPYLSPYSSEPSTAINARVSHLLATLPSPTTIRLITDRFSSLTGDNAKYQAIALSTLANIKTNSSYSELAKLLGKFTANERINSEISDFLSDSLQLTRTLLPQMLSQLHDTILGPSLAVPLLKLIDSAHITSQDIYPASAQFCKMASSLFSSFSENEMEYYDYEFRATVRLLAVLNTPESVQTLNTYVTVKNKYWRKHALLQLLKTGSAAPQHLIDEIAGDREMRSYFYDDLKEGGHEKLFPKKYLTQAYFAESEVYAYATDEVDVTSITFLKAIDANYEGTKYTFYLYKVGYEDGEPYLGIAGGYSSDKKSIKPVKDLSGLHEFKEGSSLSELLKEYLVK